MPAHNAIPFFTDQCVPDSVGNVLVELGHSLIRLRDVMDTTSADPVIEVACSRSGQVLVTHDHDFKVLSRRLQITQRQYQKSLHRIHLRCPEPRSADRIRDAITLIEAEWVYPRGDRPMVVEITLNAIRTVR